MISCRKNDICYRKNDFSVVSIIVASAIAAVIDLDFNYLCDDNSCFLSLYNECKYGVNQIITIARTIPRITLNNEWVSCGYYKRHNNASYVTTAFVQQSCQLCQKCNWKKDLTINIHQFLLERCGLSYC